MLILVGHLPIPVGSLIRNLELAVIQTLETPSSLCRKTFALRLTYVSGIVTIKNLDILILFQYCVVCTGIEDYLIRRFRLLKGEQYDLHGAYASLHM